jgi:hypothetical protein
VDGEDEGWEKDGCADGILEGILRSLEDCSRRSSYDNGDCKVGRGLNTNTKTKKAKMTSMKNICNDSVNIA